MRSRSIKLLSGVSAFAVLAAFNPALAADTVSGPGTTDPYTNAETDSVTINLDATIRADATTNDSFFNGKAMSNTAPTLIINDSLLLGDLVNQGSMIATTGSAITILNDSQVDGQVSNSGLISATLIGISLTDDSTIGGGIANSGTIGAGSTAILIGDDSELIGGVTNSGLISANGAGLRVNDAEAELWGGIANTDTGAIVGGTNAAIALSGAIYDGGISNAGLITGQTSAFGIYMTGGTFSGSITNADSGIIQTTAVSRVAIEITSGTFDGSITNSGSILGEATNDVAIRISGTTDFNGSITNTGAIRGDVVVIVLNNATFDGSIVNAGEITSNNGVGITENATTFTGNIDNQLGGTVDAPSTAILITSTTFAGNFTNSGSINSTSGDAVVINAAAFTGNFTNSGYITALDNAFVFTGALFTGGVDNSGTISSSNDALRVETGTTVTGGIGNAGEIRSTSEDGIDINGTVSGSIANSPTGTVFGLRDGIDVDDTVTGGITNQGTIIGETGAAIDLSSAGAAHVITQSSGLIRGGDGATTGTALNLANAVVDTVNANGGTIDGDIDGSAGDDVVMTPGDTFVFLRGTATTIDRFDMAGSGIALLGASGRGATGAGVTIGAVSMTHGGEGTLYLDDDTVVNLTGSFTQTAGALEYFLTPDTTPGTYGEINAAAAANLDGRVAAFIDPLAFAVAGGDTFTYQDVITGTTAGTFDNAGAIDTNSLFFEGIADVNAADVDIILTRQAFSSVILLPGLTQNQAAVGGALETIFGNGGYGADFEDLYTYLFGLPAGSEEDVQQLYDELAGTEHAGTQEVGLRMSYAFDNAIGERLDDLRLGEGQSLSANSRPRRYAQADAIVVSDAMPAGGYGLRGPQNVGIWAQAYGDWTAADGDLEAAAYDQDTNGVAGGIDFALNQNWHGGAAIGWSNADVEFATPGDDSEIDAFHAAVYAAVESGQFYADAVLSFGMQDIDTVRELDLGFGTFGAASAYDATTWGLRGEAGWVVRFDGGSFEPFASLRYANLSTDGFSETGADAYNLVVAGQDADSLSSSLGARLSGEWTDGGVRLMPRLEVAWRHEFMDERRSFLASFEEDPTTRFQIVSSALSPDSAVVKAGLGAELDRGFVVFLDYNGVYNSAATSHGATAGLRAAW